jgi:hypothetical protein
MRIDPFTVNVTDEVLEDLEQRIRLTRWADDFGNDEWQYGTNGRYLHELLSYWLDSYDWRRQEQAINSLPHFRTAIDDVPIHFIHVRGKGPKPLRARRRGNCRLPLTE